MFDFDKMVADAGDMARDGLGEAPRFIAFASLSMPAQALRQMMDDVTRAGGVVVFRGLTKGSAKVMTEALGKVLGPGERMDGVGIDPRLFRAFHSQRSPRLRRHRERLRSVLRLRLHQRACTALRPDERQRHGRIRTAHLRDRRRPRRSDRSPAPRPPPGRPAMSRFALAFFLATALPCFAQAQTTTQAAKADGKAFGNDIGTAAQNAATTQPNADRVPGYSGTPSQSGYFDDPKAMERAAASQASANTGYQTMRDSSASRATFSKVDLDAAIARSKTISEDSLSYTSGMTVGGTQGRCVPLPPASGTAARYKATCNTGYTVDSSTQSCTVTLQASVTTVTDYLYYCPKLDPECTAFDLATCRFTGSHPGKCLQGIDTPTGYKCFEPGDPIAEYTCSEPVAGLTPVRVTPRQVVTTTRDESQCASLAADANCTSGQETCTDSDPVTRIVDG
jgi:type-F conjugative transfer system pilin assembly protein TrbC